MPARVSSGDLSNHAVDGKITRTAQAINSQARTLHVEVDLPNEDGSLVPGMYVQVGFQLPAAGLFQVPAAALAFSADGPQVAIVGADSRVTFRKVTIARDNGSVVELGSGVSLGDRVVLNISSQIADGEKVTVSGSEDGVASAVPPAR